ncbi:MAG: Flp family type IVb pilin [Parvibaculaceae bacterium]
MTKLMRFVKDESGVTAIEYGLIAAAMGIMLVVAMPTLSGAIKSVFTKIGTDMGTATGWTQ